MLDAHVPATTTSREGHGSTSITLTLAHESRKMSQGFSSCIRETHHRHPLIGRSSSTPAEPTRITSPPATATLLWSPSTVCGVRGLTSCHPRVDSLGIQNSTAMASTTRQSRHRLRLPYHPRLHRPRRTAEVRGLDIPSCYTDFAVDRKSTRLNSSHPV